MATTISVSRTILTSSTWIDGVRSAERVIRPSTKLLAMLVSHSATIRSAPSLISSSGVSRRSPSTIETESSVSISRLELAERCSRPRTSHADIDTSRTTKVLRMTEVTSLMTSHAKASLAATASR